MKKRICALILLLAAVLCLCACTGRPQDSAFGIRFLDVGQGDAALVECDGRCMLIDGGDVSAGDKVYDALEKQGIQRLDILVVSHLHTDHYGGLTKALTYASSIGVTLSNASEADTKAFRDFAHQLQIDGSRITVPAAGDTYQLGSATVEVVDASAEADNDSLVLLITYGDTRFLFTGDIEEAAQTRIADKYQREDDKPYQIDLMKLPHHGSYTGTLYRFLRTFMPDCVIISCGAGNPYGHPHPETLNLFDGEAWQPDVYRTDRDGDIIVRSDGKSLSVETGR